MFIKKQMITHIFFWDLRLRENGHFLFKSAIAMSIQLLQLKEKNTWEYRNHIAHMITIAIEATYIMALYGLFVSCIVTNGRWSDSLKRQCSKTYFD